MASEATLDKYRQKIGRMDLDTLREEIVKLEDLYRSVILGEI